MATNIASLKLNQLLKPRILITLAISALVGIILVRTIANRLNFPQLNDLLNNGV